MANLKQKASEIYFQENTGLSDVDGTSIEWDGIYGTYWRSYNSQEEMDAALEKYKADYTAGIEKIYNQLVEEAKLRRINFENSRNTLGNLFPELKAL